MRATSAISAVLIAIPFVVYFAIPSYNITNPTFDGTPFFWWYQLAWLAISAVLYFVAAVLLGREG